MSSSALQNSFLNSLGGGSTPTPGTGTFTRVNGGDGVLSSNPAGPTTALSADYTALVKSIGSATAPLKGDVIVTATNNATGGAGLSVVATSTGASAGTLAFNFNAGAPPGQTSISSAGITTPAFGAVVFESQKMAFTSTGGDSGHITFAMNDDFAVAELNASGAGITGTLQMSGAVAVETGAGITFAGSTASTNGAGGVLKIASTGGGGVIASGRATILATTGTTASAIALPAGTTLSATSVIVVQWTPNLGAGPVQATPAGCALGVNQNGWDANPGSFVVTSNPHPTADTQITWALIVA